MRPSIARALPYLLIIVWSFGVVSCAEHAPPSLTAVGKLAWQQTQVVSALDVLRDTALAAEAQTPPLVAHATVVKIVQAHQLALVTIQASASGWQASVTAALTALEHDLSAAEHAKLGPYLTLIQTLLQGVA